MRADRDGLTRYGMDKFQRHGAKLLRKQPAAIGKFLGGGRCVLRIAEDGEAGGKAVQPELVRAPRDRVQAELCAAAAALQNGKFAHGGLAVRRNFAQEASARAARDGKVDDARVLIRRAENEGFIGFADGVLTVQAAEQRVDVR